MKTNLRFMALVLLGMMLSVNYAWGAALTTSDLNWGTPIVNADFNTLSEASASGKSKSSTTVTNATQYGPFTHYYFGKSSSCSIAIKNATSPMTTTFFRLSATSNVATASFNRNDFGSSGAFSFVIDKNSMTYIGLYNATSSDGTAYSKANGSVYLQFTGSKIQINKGNVTGNWQDVVTSLPSTTLIEITVVYNNTTTATTYGNNQALAAKSAHVFINGTRVETSGSATSFTIPGATLGSFRVAYNNTSTINLDDIKIYDALPTAASTKTAVSVAVADGQSSMGTVKLYDTSYEEVSGGTGEFKKDDEISIYAKSEDGFRFTNWTLNTGTDATWISGSSENDDYAGLKVGSKEVTATAHFAQEYTISVTQNNENMGKGAFNTSPSTYSKAMIANEQVEIVATVVDDDAYEFVNWTVEPANAVTFANATAATTTITATAQGASVKANFQTKTTKYAAYIDVNESTYGSATINGNDTGVEVAAGTGMTVVASNNTGYVFKNWSADPSASVTFADASAATTTFTMPASEVTVTANFEEAPAAVLTLSENGTTREYKGIKVNTPFNLPACQVSCDKVFMGWSESSTSYATLYKAGDSYTMTATTGTLYAWFATETPGETTDVYTMNITKNTSNSAYATYYDVTFNSIGWKMPGNQNIGAYVKMGGKFSTDSRYIYSKNAISSGVDKVVANHGVKDDAITVNSVTLDVYSTANLAAAGGTGDISSVAGTYVDNGNTTFERPSTANWTGRFYRITYNLSSSASGSNKGIILYSVKMQSAGAPTYSDYAVTCSAVTAAPEFSVPGGTYTTAQTITLSSEQGATIYYTTDGTEPTTESDVYEEAFVLDEWGTTTIKAIAKAESKAASEPVSATYKMDIPFTSLETLAATDMGSVTSTTVTVSFTNTKIKSIATTYQGRVGVYFDIQKEEKDIEIYCASVPEAWEAGGKLSKSNLTCTWKRYPATGNLTCWELTPSNWDGFEYSAPDPYTSVSDLYAAGLAEGAKVYLNITNAYVHTKTYTNPNNFIYIQDGEVGIVLRTSEEFSDENIGKLMTAKIVGTIASSNGRPQIAVTSMSDVSYTTGSRPTAVETTLSASEEADKILSLVKIEGVYAQSKSSNNITVTTDAAGQETSYNIYDLFGQVQTLPESNKAINIKGLFYKKVDGVNTTYSITPVLTTDFEVVSPSQTILPTLDIYGGTSAEPLAVAPGKPIVFTRVESTLDASKYESYYQIDDASPVKVTAKTAIINLTGENGQKIKVKIYSTRPYYTTNEAEYYYQIDNSKTEYSITYPSAQTYVGITGSASAVPSTAVVMTGTQKKNHYYPGVVKVYYVADPDNNPTDTTWIDVNRTEVSKTEATYSFTMPAHAVAVKMGYTKDPTYSVTYKSGGKSPQQGEAPTESAQFAGDSVTVKENTWTDTKYEFNGWRVVYETGTGDQKEQHDIEVKNGKFKMPANDVKIIAQWVDIYAVTFDKGSAPATGDAPTMNAQREGAKFNMPTSPWTATGYSFAGWKASSDDVTYAAGAEFTMPAKAVTFTAQWEGAEYTKDGQWEIIKDNDELEAGRYYVLANNKRGTATDSLGGSSSKYLTVATTTFSDGETSGDKAVILKTNLPSKAEIFVLAGNSTDGWTLQSVKTDKYLSISSDNPQWEESSSTKWNLTVSSGGTTTMKVRYSATSESDKFIRCHNDNGFRMYASNAGSVTTAQLYRFYRAAFKVTYDANGGTGAPAATKADPTTQIATLSSTVPTKTGNTFTGWTTAQGGTGTKYQAGAQFGPMNKNETLYAQWELKTYNVAIASVEHAAVFAKQKYTSDENKFGEGESKDIQYGKTITLSYNSVEENYVFKSWNVTKATDPSVTVSVTDNEFVVPDYAVTISAVFEKSSEVTYKLTYDANGGEGTMEGNPFTKGYNAYITVSNNKNGEEDIFTKDLCTFTGWNTKEDGSGTAYAAGAHFYIKSDVTLYAQWKGVGATYRLDNSYEGKIKVTVGTAPKGSNAVYSNTFNGEAYQVSQGNTMTITLTGYDNLVVKNINADMRSNGSNSANIDIAVGGNLVYSKKYADLGADNQKQYQNIDLIEFGFNPIKIGDGQSIVFTITSPTHNSAYIQNITLEFGAGYSRTFTNHNVSTVCVPYAVKPEDRFGAAFYEIAYKTKATDDETTKIYYDEVSPEEDLVAGKPYVIIPEKETMVLVYSGEAVETPVAGTKGLTGTFTAIEDDVVGTDGNILEDNYIFSQNKYWLCKGKCSLAANRAYIKASIINASCTPVAPAPGRRRIVMGANGTEEVTTPNIPTDLINTSANADEVRKVIINNQMYIIRNGRIYNAAGALVK